MRSDLGGRRDARCRCGSRRLARRVPLWDDGISRRDRSNAAVDNSFLVLIIRET
jgi:hypothetical protein